MSNMIPQPTADVLRAFSNISVDIYGIDCTLYIPNNLNQVLVNDTYIKPEDYTFDKYSTKVWIEWAPNKRQLAKIGIFAEDELPMVAYFSNIFRNAFRNVQDIDITIGSYFSVDAQHIADNKISTNEFDIVDVVMLGMANKLVTKVFRIAPRRVKT